jgi:hypothetical protein
MEGCESGTVSDPAMVACQGEAFYKPLELYSDFMVRPGYL